MAFQWRRFQFFDKELLGEAQDGVAAPASQPSQLFNDFTPTCCTSGRGHLIFGDARGYLKLINRDLEESRWQAFESGVLHVHQLKKSNILVSIGNEGGLNNTTIKIWRLDKSDAEGNPMLARALKVFSSKFPAVPVTSFSVLEDLSQLALGLGNGAVMLFDGNILRDRNVKQSLIQGQGKTVVAVHFREPDAPVAPAGGAGAASPSAASSSGPQKTPPPISLFVVTTASVSTIYTKHPRLARMEIDGDNGCEELAGTCMNDEKRLVLATKDAVFFYEPEEKREAYGFEGAKKICTWFNGYLVLVCENNKSIDMVGGPAAGAGEGIGGKKAMAPKPVQSTPDTLTIYDLKNKFIAYTLKMESIAMLVSEFSSLFVVTHDRKFFQLSEHDLNSKMERLFKMNLYQISISLASNSSMDRGYVMDIFQRYGDHLYSKGDYDGAIQQYLETIKYVEPSYVIRKFLDAQRIHNLTRYLQALHEKGRANTDHTTLLLNCYTKLKDVAKLDQFVKQSDVGGSSGGLAFDVLTAINVCRQANYYDHALYLARKHGEHALYLSIQIEDQNNVLDAMSYIAALPSFKEAEKYMKEYGSKLVNAFPRETTKLLINLCTGWVPTPMPFASPVDASSHALSPSANAVLSPSASGALSPSAAPSSQRSNPAEFIHLFVEHTAELEMFLSHFFEPQHAHILQMLSNQSSASAAGKDGASSSSSAVAVSKDTKNPQTIVCNTLLELYLRQYAAFETAKKSKAAAEAKADGKASASAAAGAASPVPSNSHHDNPYYNRAYNFIKLSYGRYDADLALVLCKMYSFEKGITHLYEKLRFYHEILQYHMEHHQAAAILATCNRHGDKVPNLWVQALAYFAAQPEPYEEAIQTVLRAIKDRKLMPPLMILQILSANPRKELGVVKDFIVASLAEENDIIAADQEEIHRFQTETATMKEEIIRLHTQPITFQGLKCHQCTSGLSLPAVHFLCMHSFHQRCVADSEQECPKCTQQYRQVRSIRDSMKSATTQHDKFFKRLEEEQDGFSVVADYFGRGLFEAPDNASSGKLPAASP